jgi:Leucine-rich repeat (LRR) protein
LHISHQKLNRISSYSTISLEIQIQFLPISSPFFHLFVTPIYGRLDLSANWLSEGGLPSDAFLGLESLQRLSLDKNQLSRVPTEAIGELADSLEELFLSANQIDQIQPGQIPPLPRLKSLGMDANQVRRKREKGIIVSKEWAEAKGNAQRQKEEWQH